MKALSWTINALIEGTIIYVTYYGFCGFWWVLFNPYKGG